MSKVQDNIAIRKRAQIAKANKVMFISVAIASAVLSLSVVCSYFLIQKLVFNEKILSEKQHTVSTLYNDNSVINQLTNNIRALNSNQSLISNQTETDGQPIQVILDALPSSSNSLALGASLQSSKLLLGVSGLNVESLSMNDTSANNSTTVTSVASSSSANSIGFSFTVTATDNKSFYDALVKLENSIRIINIQTIDIQAGSTTNTMTVNGVAYYQPSKTLNLYNKVVKP
jgi:cell division protein FtsL